MFIIPCSLTAPGEQIRVNGTLYYVHREVKALLTEMRGYSPDPGVHTGDRLMACWMANYAAKSGAFVHRVATGEETLAEDYAQQRDDEEDLEGSELWEELGGILG